jgi:nucleoside-diphosphate-sugar epimerase
MRILVAGANGYLGGRISEYLAGQGHSVTALVHRLPEDSGSWQKKMTRVIEGDAASEETLVSALRDDIDSIVFTISLDHRMSGQDPSRTLDINVGIFWKLLAIYSRKAGGRVIYLSTQQVYGRYENNAVINESTPLIPVNAYGLTHQYCEELGSLYTREKGFKCISIRLSNSFGAPVFPECNCWWLAINDLCKMALEKGEIKLISDGTPQRDFIPAGDVCRAIEILATAPFPAIEYPSYNLGSGRTHTILEVAHETAETCAKKYGKDVPVVLPDNKISPNARRRRDIPRFRYDISRIQRLGFTPSTSLLPGIEEVLDYLEKAGESFG